MWRIGFIHSFIHCPNVDSPPIQPFDHCSPLTADHYSQSQTLTGYYHQEDDIRVIDSFAGKWNLFIDSLIVLWSLGKRERERENESHNHQHQEHNGEQYKDQIMMAGIVIISCKKNRSGRQPDFNHDLFSVRARWAFNSKHYLTCVSFWMVTLGSYSLAWQLLKLTLIMLSLLIIILREREWRNCRASCQQVCYYRFVAAGGGGNLDDDQRNAKSMRKRGLFDGYFDDKTNEFDGKNRWQFMEGMSWIRWEYGVLGCLLSF